MADPIVPNAGELRLLEEIRTALATWEISLFKTDYTPDADSDTADFESPNEADYSGYARQTVTWSAVSTDGSGRAQMVSDPITFPVAGSSTQTVYGWAIFGAPGEVIQARRFTSPVTITTTAGVDTFMVIFRLYQP